jgi:hypothetical protein
LSNLDVLNWSIEDSRVELIELHVVEEEVHRVGREEIFIKSMREHHIVEIIVNGVRILELQQ